MSDSKTRTNVRRVLIGIMLAAAFAGGVLFFKILSPSLESHELQSIEDSVPVRVAETNLTASTPLSGESEKSEPAKDDAANAENTSPSSFAEQYDRFMEAHARRQVPEFTKAGFRDQETYEAAVEEEWRFVANKYQEHTISYMRDGMKLSEDQIQKIVAIEEIFSDEYSNLYRVKADDSASVARQKDDAWALTKKRHASYLDLISAVQLNELELERARFFRAAKDRFNLKALDWPD